MKQDDFDALWTLFEEAMDLAPAELPAWLDERLPETDDHPRNAELRRDLEELLVARTRAALDLSPAALAEVAGEVLTSPTASRDFVGPSSLPRYIGPYRILHELGRGGMGVVYLARQTSPERDVALKVLRDLHDPAASVPRFLRESRLLARLQHPGIARVIEADVASVPSADSGAATLLPYFAMEYVEGLPLTVHADANHLSIPARLELLARICDAVDHAHDQGIVHRDLKPSNILIASETMRAGEEAAGIGQPKVLDFGVARCLLHEGDPASLRTRTGQLVGTLPYMSPEQVGADPNQVDARSDVYALGVIAHELLAKRLPLNIAGLPPAEAVVVIRDRDCAPVGQIDPRLKGDVETMIATALAKEPERRYPSAGAFAADIRRHLNDRPIQARPASRIYLIGKFVRRHRGLVAGMAFAIMALVAGIIAATSFALRAESAAEEAEAQGKVARRERARAQRELYAASLGSAQDAIDSSDWEAAESFLGLSLPEQRGWEWDYLKARIPRREVLTKLGGRRCVAFRRDGVALTVDARDDRLVLLDLDRSKIIASFETPAGGARRSALTASFSADGSTFGAMLVPPHPSADGTGSSDRARLIICDTATGELKREMIVAAESVRRLALSADGELFGLYTETGCACYPTMKKLGGPQSADEPLFVREGKVRIIHFGPMGQVALRFDADSEIVNARTGATIARSRRARCNSFAFSPDGKTLAFRGNSEIVICDAATFTPRRRIQDIGDSIYGIAFIDNDRIIYTRNDHWVSVQHLDEESPRTRFALGVERSAMFAIAPDRREILLGLRRGVARYLIDKADQAMTLDSYGYDVVFHPRGDFLATRDFEGAVRLWDWKAARLVAEFRGPKDAGSLSFSDDGLRLTSARFRGDKAQIATWNLLTGSLDESVVTAAAYRASFRPGQEHTAVGARSPDGGRMVWRLPSGEATVAPFADVQALAETSNAPTTSPGDRHPVLPRGTRLYCAEFSRDGRYLATGHLGGDGGPQLFIRDASTGAIIHALAGHRAGCMTLSFSPDGSRLVSAGREATIVWDVVRGEALMRLQGHQSYVHGVAFSPDGSVLVSVAGDRTVRLWDSCPRHQRRLEATEEAMARAEVENQIDQLLGRDEPHMVNEAIMSGGGSLIEGNDEPRENSRVPSIDDEDHRADRRRPTRLRKAARQVLVERGVAPRPRLLESAPVAAKNSGATGPSSQDGRLRHRFQLTFSEPVEGLRPEDLQLAGSLAPFARITRLQSELGPGLHFTEPNHRALIRGVSLGAPSTIAFWMRREGRFPEAAILSYAVPERTNEILLAADGLVSVRDTFLGRGLTTNRLRWQHVSLVFDAETQTLRSYFDGRLTHEVAMPGPPESGGTLVLADDQDAIGGSFDDEQGFLGALDELRIWSRVLTPAEIRESREAPASNKADGLAHAWSFNSVSPDGQRTPDIEKQNPFELQNGARLGEGAPSRRWFVEVEIRKGDPSANSVTGQLSVGLRDGTSVRNCAGHALQLTHPAPKVESLELR